MSKLLTLVVTPYPSSAGKFKARLEGQKQILRASKQPFLDGARALLEQGYDPDNILVMRHAGSDLDSLRGKLGVAATLTVDESNTPRFRKWKTYSSREGRSPSDFSEHLATQVADGVQIASASVPPGWEKIARGVPPAGANSA
jgi:hypothetical protein